VYIKLYKLIVLFGFQVMIYETLADQLVYDRLANLSYDCEKEEERGQKMKLVVGEVSLRV